MDDVHHILKKLLIAAGIIYIIGITVILSDLYMKVGRIEHSLMHVTGKH